MVIKQKTTNENELLTNCTVFTKEGNYLYYCSSLVIVACCTNFCFLYLLVEEATRSVGVDRSFAGDSGVDINTSKSSRLLCDPTSIPKKSVSIAFIEDT